jgi:hypothetical protein
MGIRSVTAVSPDELHLEYETSPTKADPQSRSNTNNTNKQAADETLILMLRFDPLTKRLANAGVSVITAWKGEGVELIRRALVGGK